MTFRQKLMINHKEYVNFVIDKLEKYSLRRDTRRYRLGLARLKLEALSAHLKNIDAIHKTLATTIKYIDPHSGLTTPAQRQKIEQAQEQNTKPVTIKRSGKNKGTIMVTIPSFQGNEKEGAEWAQNAHNRLKEIEEQGPIDHIVFDLREDTGGNLGAHLAVIGPFVQEGRLASFKFKHPNEVEDEWHYNNGEVKFTLNGNAYKYVADPYTSKNKHVPINVIIGPNTESSGESLAIVLNSQPNLKVTLIGKKTKGYTTGNDAFQLPDGAIIQSPGAVTVDLKGKTHDGPVKPTKAKRRHLKPQPN